MTRRLLTGSTAFVASSAVVVSAAFAAPPAWASPGVPTATTAVTAAGSPGALHAAQRSRTDFDGDGLSDLVIGNPSYPTDRRPAAGAVEIAYGNGRKQRLTLDQARDRAGHPVSTTSGDEFGSAFAIGHFTGTRYNDLIVTTFREAPGGHSGLTLFRGSATGLQTPGLFLSQTTVDPADGSAFSGFGFYITAGDSNGDGITDVAVAAHHVTIAGNKNSGAVFIIPGSTGGLKLNDISRFDLKRTAAFGHPPLANEFFGYGLAAGDFNGDGRTDLAIEDGETVHGKAGAGRIHLLYGSAHGLTASTTSLDSGAAAQAYAYFGLTLAAGDITGDGTDDLVVGTPYETVRGHANAGSITLYPGSPSGLRPTVSRTITQDSAGVPGGGSATGRMLGLGLAIGDLTGDTHNDVAASVEGQTVDGRANAGAVLVLRGSSGGFSGSQLLTESTPVAGHYFGGGVAVLSAAGTGKDSLAVAAPLAAVNDVAGSGTVAVYAGGAGRIASRTVTRYTLGQFPGTANRKNAGMGGYLFAPPGGPAMPVVNTLAG